MKFSACFSGESIIAPHNVVSGAAQIEHPVCFFHPLKIALGAVLIGKVFAPAFAARKASKTSSEFDYFAGLNG